MLSLQHKVFRLRARYKYQKHIAVIITTCKPPSKNTENLRIRVDLLASIKSALL